jgi:hypothetical protein
MEENKENAWKVQALVDEATSRAQHRQDVTKLEERLSNLDACAYCTHMCQERDGDVCACNVCGESWHRFDNFELDEDMTE